MLHSTAPAERGWPRLKLCACPAASPCESADGKHLRHLAANGCTTLRQTRNTTNRANCCPNGLQAGNGIDMVHLGSEGSQGDGLQASLSKQTSVVSETDGKSAALPLDVQSSLQLQQGSTDSPLSSESAQASPSAPQPPPAQRAGECQQDQQQQQTQEEEDGWRGSSVEAEGASVQDETLSALGGQGGAGHSQANGSAGIQSVVVSAELEPADRGSNDFEVVNEAAAASAKPVVLEAEEEQAAGVALPPRAAAVQQLAAVASEEDLVVWTADANGMPQEAAALAPELLRTPAVQGGSLRMALQPAAGGPRAAARAADTGLPVPLSSAGMTSFSLENGTNATGRQGQGGGGTSSSGAPAPLVRPIFPPEWEQTFHGVL